MSQTGSKLTINQTSANAILNWQSFNISSDGTVQFVQPSASSVALNEIYDSNPTQIFGALDANGRVFLINQNGIVFGAGTQVNVGGLVASTLQVSPTVATVTGSNPQYVGLLGSQSSGGTSAVSAFSVATDANGDPVRGTIQVQQGATIQAADGGEIYMFASKVTNLGTIHTPDGQTILAAGDQVYLAESTTSDLRGMLVEVQGNGMVQNGLASNSGASSPQQLVGQVIAEHGNISLAALAVNQYGRVSANTSVTENGSIYLQARTGSIHGNSDEPSQGGTLMLGQNSDTEVSLDTSDPTTTVDSVAQPKSTIQMSGKTIDMLEGSVVRATSGTIDVYADSSLSTLGGSGSTGGDLTNLTDTSDGSRFYMAPGAQVDVSGADITLPVSDNVIAVPLYATELADSPLQRNGPLHGQTVYIDIRAHGTSADGSTWWGTPLANATGEIQGISRNVVERNLTGGTVSIQSQGDVILAPNSKIDVSGGYIQYTGGYVNTSQLLTLWGQTIPIASADPYLPYAGVVNSFTTTDSKWGVKQTYNTTPTYYSPGYFEGKDAGKLDLTATAFIMDGSVSASTVVGAYQVQPTTAEPTTDAGWSQSAWLKGSMYRPYDEVPQGATLQIGSPNTGVGGVRVLGNVTVAPGGVLAGLTNADGSAFNPLTDGLPANFGASVLQPGIIDSFGHVAIYTDGKLIEPSGSNIALSEGGSFTGEADVIDIEGAIDAPAGAIALTAQPNALDETSVASLTVGAGASLTARGAWVNESTVLYPNGNPAPLYIGGGTISLKADTPNDLTHAADMRLDPGSVIDVSGGAELTSSGALEAGAGGSIKIDASTASVSASSGLSITSPLPPTQLMLGASLRGYGVEEGGSLSISAPGICISATACSGSKSSVLWLTPQFFSSGGFSNYAITADQNGLDIAPGTVIQPVQSNLVLAPGYTSKANAAALSGITTPTELPLPDRKPVDLSLTLAYPANTTVDNGVGPQYYVALLGNVPSLTLPQGVVISTDPGGSISLTSNTRLDVEGTLRAPGGKISLDLGGTLPSYDPSQGIWLGSRAVLDASGVAQIYPNRFGELTGSVLSGGQISIDAGSGYLELLPGSLINVSGASGFIDIIPWEGGVTQGQQIASAGGSVTLFTQDGGVVDSTLLAAAGVAGREANQPAGGSFSLTLDSSGAVAGTPSVVDQITVSPTIPPSVVAPGSPVPDALLGQVLLPANRLAQGDFGMVALKSYVGRIDFSGGVTLSAATEVSLDAMTYSVDPGTTANVQAPYVEFGSSSTPYGMAPTDAVPLPVSGGTGVLNVSGGFIELYGTSSLEGVGTVSFDSTGDLRVRGLQGFTSEDIQGYFKGGLYADGTIDLTAQQIYPVTLTQFVFSTDPRSDLSSPKSGSIVIHGSEGSNHDLLSAAGSLSLSAASITQDGVLRAPFGTIALYANTLTLGNGSITSTSADGETIPFGTTQGGAAWIYSMGTDSFGEPYYATVYGNGDGAQALPSQRVSLNAANIDVQHGATIDLSGGGDLQAYEWTPGTGGTKDVLASSGSYAIVPALHAEVAPYDPVSQSSSGSSPLLGQAVYLSGGSGVPAGTYLLLPSRYALLPGAFLVTPMPGTGYQDMQPGQTARGADGGTIVAGYLTTHGLSYAESRWNGFDVTPPSVFLSESQYTVTSANQFFTAQETNAASQTAADNAVSAMRLPEDAGILVLAAGNSLTIDGSLRTTAQNGARGAGVDISNPNIVIAADATSAPQSGALVLTTTSLNQLGAQTLLIGGQNQAGTLATTAQSISVLDGASLTGPQILLTAQDLISVESGAAITGKGSGPAGSSFSLSGDGAFLAVSGGQQASVTRTGAVGAQGTLDLAAGSTLSASQGSIYLDATGNMATQGNIVATGGSLAVRAPAIALGNAPSGFQGAVIGESLLGSGSFGSLLLIVDNAQASGGGNGTPVTPEIQVDDGASVNAQNIILDTPELTSGLSAGQTATLSASNRLTLGDSVTVPPTNASGVPPTTGGTGSLVLSAPTIALGSNLTDTSGTSATSTAALQQIDIGGFGSVALNAQGNLTAAYNATLSTHTNLSITASHVTSAAGVATSLDAGYTDASGVFHSQGSVTLMSPNTSSALQSAPPLGGSLTVMGSSIDIGTHIDLPSGNVTLIADGTQPGGITLESTGAINVSGVVERYASDTISTPGGKVSLSATGDIILDNGSLIDVSAGTGGAGGSLSLSAPTGRLVAQGTLNGQGQAASFSADAADFAFDSLRSVVNATAGAFTGAQGYRLRGTISGGNTGLTLGSADTLKASNVLLEADNGSVEVDGTVDASGASSGNVTLAAANAITLNGSIDANATASGQNGGTVELDLGQQGSQLTVNGSGLINVSGGGVSQSGEVQGATVIRPGSGGTVLLRVPYANAQWLSRVTLGGSIKGASSTALEVYNVFSPTATDAQGDVVIDASAADLTNPQSLFSQAQQYVGAISSSEAASLAQLAPAAAWNLSIQPGVEIDATGGITLNTPWDLNSSGWRASDPTTGAQDIPGVLTLRAGGSVAINDTLSDGVGPADSHNFLTLANQPSWSYRIVAGADGAGTTEASADPLAATGMPADVTIGSPTSSPVQVRTGTGFIEVAASRDFVLANSSAVLYTAGVDAGAAPVAGSSRLKAYMPDYSTGGGNISIDVGRNVVGAADTTQFVNDWQWRGEGTTASGQTALSWSVDLANFNEGVGALGGGNVTVHAGRDVSDFSAAIASVGDSQAGNVAIENGGQLTVAAGRNIAGGTYYVGLGTLTLSAGGSVETSQSTGLAPLIGLGDASVSVTATANVAVTDIVNPTLLNLGISQSAFTPWYFSTYGATSSATLTAVGGNVMLTDSNLQAAATRYGVSFRVDNMLPQNASLTDASNTNALLDYLPSTFDVYSFGGDVQIARGITLAPSVQAGAQILANQSVIFGVQSTNAAAYITVPDVDASSLPNVGNPTQDGDGTALTALLNISDPFDSNTTTTRPYASTPAFSSVTAFDENPVTIVAQNGDVAFPRTNGATAWSGVWSAKPVVISAGRDVIELNLVAQNLTAGDVTSIIAGRDITYPEVRTSDGNLSADLDGIVVAGPGELQVSAGRNVDLGTSNGITTIGNQQNGALATSGASVSVEAGVAATGSTAAEYDAFIKQYIDGSSDFDPLLVSYVEQITGASSLTSTEAKQTFDAMPAAQQRTFIEQLFFHLLKTYGEEAVKSGNNADYAGAYAAIEKLFPGGNAAAASSDPYSGAISLYFSQIYTYAGGNISLLAPGGQINAGLAIPPAGFGISKSPQQLGIVAASTGDVNAFTYSDFQVNQSRVFAADGGNILVWSAQGNIDAGRGSKTSLSASAPTIGYDNNGFATITYFPPTSGSGIQALADTPGVTPGLVDLFAPHGVVNANEAGIVAGNLIIGATRVLGASNISVSGTAFGVPTQVTGLGTQALSGSSAAAGAASSAQSSVAQNSQQQKQAPKAEAALRWLDVFVLGFGEETCSANDIECLKRQKHSTH